MCWETIGYLIISRLCLYVHSYEFKMPGFVSELVTNIKKDRLYFMERSRDNV